MCSANLIIRAEVAARFPRSTVPNRVDAPVSVLGAYPGPCDVYLHCTTPEHWEITVHATSACMVKPSPKLVTQVEELIGDDCLWFSAASELPKHNDGSVSARPLSPKERAIATRKSRKLMNEI